LDCLNVQLPWPIRTCVCVCMYVCMHVCICMYVCVYIYIYIYIYICVCVCVCVCVCIYVRVYVCVCMHVLWKPVYDWLLFLAFPIYWTACVAKLLHFVCCHNSHSFLCTINLVAHAVSCALFFTVSQATEHRSDCAPVATAFNSVGRRPNPF